MGDAAASLDAAAFDRSGAVEGVAPVTLVVEGVHVAYRVYEDRKPSVRDVLTGRGRARRHRVVEAVRGVDLVAHEGESLGIIGRNGSGKSTLLQTMAGLLPPDSGRVLARSQPTLLGVNAALNGNLSGRRNVHIGGLALGLSPRQVEERFDEIVDFAGVRDSIDLPLRTYSSGMRARLQFAISTAVMPEVLLIDETFAVGDQDFREQSGERIAQLRDNAGTVVLVSHGMGLILEMCTRVSWLDAGRVMLDGEPAEVVRAYQDSTRAAR